MAPVTAPRQTHFRSHFQVHVQLGSKRFLHALCGGLLLLCVGLAAGCGYRFRGASGNAWKEEGIQRVYLQPLGNETYWTGAEDLVFNAVQRYLAASGMFRLVSSPRYADAVLSGVVKGAGGGLKDPGSPHDSLVTSYNQLLADSKARGETWTAAPYPIPGATGTPVAGDPIRAENLSGVFSDYQGPIGWQYSVGLICEFIFVRNRPMEGKPPLIWRGAVGRNTLIVSINQLGVFGTTTSLFKESEINRGLKEVASRVAGDLIETMSAQF